MSSKETKELPKFFHDVTNYSTAYVAFECILFYLFSFFFLLLYKNRIDFVM